MRRLDADEAALWARVTASIRPLSRDAADPHPPPPPLRAKPPIAPARAAASAPTARPGPAPPPSGVGQTLDGGWDRAISRGRLTPDRIIDLHGHRLDSAWARIDSGLEQALADGDRVVLLITGHAPRGAPPVERGRIRAAVHDWLDASRHAPHIAAVRGAHPRHGGGGSLYIVLRRERK